MDGHYSREQLLHLKNSPLVSKPDSLPPQEEWMGPPPDPNQRKVGAPRARPDDTNHLDPFSKRPSLFDTNHNTRKSATAPEDLVLGPPKTTFSSSNARSTNSKETGEDAARVGDRRNNYEKFRKNGDGEERDNERRDTRFPAHGGRRGLREDREGWDLTKQRRNLEGEDRERRPRRNGGDRLDTREPKGPPGMGSDSRPGKDDEARFSARYDGDRRARFQQPWFKGDQSRDGLEDGASRTSHWRKDGGGGGSKIDHSALDEPEWLDASESGKQQQAHTQEDFQRWKEQMKAGAQPSDAEAEDKSHVKQTKSRENRPADIDFGPLGSDEATAPSIDSFFGMFTAATKTKGPTLSSGEGKEKEKPNSRFKSLFRPAATAAESAADLEPRTASVEPEPEPEIPASSISAAPISENADQEGFQRILQMLGGRSRNTTPQESNQDRSRTTTYVGARPLSAALNMQSADTLQSTTANEPRSRNSGGLESLLPPTSPARVSETARKSGNSRDTELLLRLMKQASINESGTTKDALRQAGNPGEGLRYTPSFGKPQAADVSNTRFPRGTSARFSDSFDDPIAAEVQSLQHEPEIQRQRQGSRPQRMPFDEAILNRLAMNQPANGPPGGRPPVPAALPTGTTRFSNLGGNSFMQQAPPGWPTQHGGQPPLPQSTLPNAPPGIPNPPNRGPNPSFPQMMQNMNPSHAPPIERNPKYTGGLGSVGTSYSSQGPPPGMGFPPGFMNNSNSNSMTPGGFPQINRSPMDNHLFGGRGLSGGQGSMMPQGSGNPMDIFATGPDGRNGGRGGGGVPGGSLYR